MKGEGRLSRHRSALPVPFIALAVLSIALALPAAAVPDQKPFSEFDQNEALAYSQAAIGGMVGDYAFTDSRGRPVSLADFRGKPLIVSMIYTSCYHTCPLITQTLARVVDDAHRALGGDRFKVISVGFDSRVDSPERMRDFAHAQGINTGNWVFLSAGPETIAALSRDLGFIFFASPKGFDHLAQTSLIDADGRLQRQVYGSDFDAPQLIDPLRSLLLGAGLGDLSLAGIWDRVHIFCTIYDPRSDRYRFDYSLLITLFAGFLTLGAILTVLIREWRRTSRDQAP